MDIKSYIASSPKKAVARRDLAKSVGVSEITVRSWANGNRYPSRRFWGDIEKATGGKVTKLDLAG